MIIKKIRNIASGLMTDFKRLIRRLDVILNTIILCYFPNLGKIISKKYWLTHEKVHIDMSWER